MSYFEHLDIGEWILTIILGICILAVLVLAGLLIYYIVDSIYVKINTVNTTFRKEASKVTGRNTSVRTSMILAGKVLIPQTHLVYMVEFDNGDDIEDEDIFNSFQCGDECILIYKLSYLRNGTVVKDLVDALKRN